MIRTALAFVFAAAVSFALSAEVAPPASTRPRPDATVRPQFRPGEKLLLVQETGWQQTLPRGGKQPAQTLRVEMHLDVSKGKAAGEVQLVCQVSRMVFEGYVPGEGKTVADTDKPATLKEGYGQYLALLKGVGFSATLTEAGELRDVAHQGRFFDRLAKSPAPAEQKRQAVEMFLAPYRDMVEQLWAYLPSRPVKPGDAWTVKRSTFAYPLITGTRSMPEQVTCTLKAVEKAAAGRVATVELSGTLQAPGGLPNPPRTSVKRTGKLRYNLDTGKLLSLRMETSGQLPGLGKMTLTRDLTLSPRPKAQTRPARPGK